MQRPQTLQSFLGRAKTMQLKGKALFNLLRINWLDNSGIEVKPWQVENLRSVPIKDLFRRLKTLGPILNEKSFYLYAENTSSPEELVDLICPEEESPEKRDRIYLLLFEIWRRLYPDQICLSIFCDELDQLIESYDKGELTEEEPLQTALQVLEDILDESYDREKDSKKIFTNLAAYCAHDLEQFLFDYISDQIQENNETYASELIDAFSDYSSDRRKFELLRTNLLSRYDLEEANLLYRRILEELAEEPNLQTLLLVGESLIHHGDIHLFIQTVKQALSLLKTEEEFQNLLAMIAEYYRCLDRDEEEKTFRKLLKSRAHHSLLDPIDLSDRALKRVNHMISKQTDRVFDV
jgi:hypothetical protein